MNWPDDDWGRDSAQRVPRHFPRLDRAEGRSEEVGGGLRLWQHAAQVPPLHSHICHIAGGARLQAVVSAVRHCRTCAARQRMTAQTRRQSRRRAGPASKRSPQSLRRDSADSRRGATSNAGEHVQSSSVEVGARQFHSRPPSTGHAARASERPDLSTGLCGCAMPQPCKPEAARCGCRGTASSCIADDPLARPSSPIRATQTRPTTRWQS